MFQVQEAEVKCKLTLKIFCCCLLSELPNCVGAIDCTHIPVKAPKERREQFKCRHGFFSLNMQMAINHRGFVTNYSVRWLGSVHDTCILKESDLQQVLDQHLLGKYYLIRDSGYKCQSNLLTPYPSEDTQAKEQ